MQIKRMKIKSNSDRPDRTDRLTTSLNSSKSGEDALLKSAMAFKALPGQVGIEDVTQLRSEQRRSTEAEMLNILAGFEGRKQNSEFYAAVIRFKEDMKNNWLGDEAASDITRRLLYQAAKTPRSKAFADVARMAEKQRSQGIRKLESQLRVLAQELTLRARSERFLRKIENIQSRSNRGQHVELSCDSVSCEGSVGSQDLFLISQCGHTACRRCLSLRTDEESCVHPGCSVPVQNSNLIKTTSFGSTTHESKGHSFGQKLDTVAKLINDFPTNDHGIIFAPNEETIEILEAALKIYDFSYHSLGAARTAAKKIEDFKHNTNPAERKKVIILNLGSEFAAGM
jgi:hypothetical protein